MTYEESYRKCKTLEELRNEVSNDISTALVIGNTDRIKIIKESAEKIVNEKFNKEDEAIEILIKYCKTHECLKDCKFHYDNGICGIHNPSAWRGENKILNKQLMEEKNG